MGSGSHSKRKKKLSQKRSKKRIKSSKDKTKKPKRLRDSDDDSVSNSSVSCYSSEDEHRSKRRARSRDRKDRKDRKKKAKRSRSVSESSGDDSPHVKKRKRSKKSKVSLSRKKRHVKKRRRSPSVSSSSGRSKSPSSCEHSDGSEREFERKDAKERKGKEKKRKGRSTSRRSRHSRSKSASPCSLHSESHSYGSEDRVVEQINPKRLKSVIVVIHDRDRDEIRETNWGENKDEIVYEHDDYPSKSNDSNDGLSRREASSYSLDVSSEKPRTLDDPHTEDVKASESLNSERLVVEETEGMTLSNIGSEVNNQLKGSTSEISPENADTNADDLAAALRQKALENLLKRQGKLATKNGTDTRGPLNVDVNSSLTLKTNHIQQRSNGLSGIQSVQRVVGDVNHTTDAPSLPKGNDASVPRRELGSSYPAEKYNSPRDFVNNRTKVGLSTSRNEFIGARNTWRRLPVSHQSSQPDHSALKATIGKDSKRSVVSEKSSESNLSVPEKSRGKDSQPQLTSEGNHQPNILSPKEPVDLDSSKGSGSSCLKAKVGIEKLDSVAASDPSAAGAHSTNEKTNEADGDSQLQQKTMSVMRGGEIVQVSYKVYIPKKVPALARRQLKR